MANMVLQVKDVLRKFYDIPYCSRLVRGQQDFIPVSETRIKWVCKKAILRVSHGFETILKAGSVREESCGASNRAEPKSSEATVSHVAFWLDQLEPQAITVTI